ncbi:MAG: Histidinol-phosphate aminotransferase [Gammaproteobacteria bacterium]|nr:Histidinol-phosphate aminotransferase [Gammaproteobacteria bacterium]
MSDGKGFPFSVAVPDVLDLAPYQPGKPMEELERELGVRNAVKLASNENPVGPAKGVLEVLGGGQPDARLYPDANGFALKQALAVSLGVSTDCITLGNGSNDVLDLLARVFVTPGDEVVFSEYAFLVYPLVTRATSGRAVVVPAQDWGHDLSAMADSVTDRTKLVFVANPNNPTGTYADARDLEDFLERVPSHVVIVLDEAYCEYVNRDDYPNGRNYLGRFPNLVVTRTFSKIHGLAGLRVGYGIAGCDITDLLNRVRQPFNVNYLAQKAGLAAIADQDHVTRCREINSCGQEGFTRFCDTMELPYIPSVANFLTVEFGARTTAIYEALLRRGIIVRSLGNYGMPRHLRITIGMPEDMDMLKSALQQIL